MFEKDEIKRFRRVVHKEMDAAGANDAMRAAGLVVVAVAFFGTNPEIVSEISGQPVPAVRKMLTRMRKQRILSGQTIRSAWHHDGFGGWLALMLDVMVVEGELDRPVDPKRSAALKGKAGRKRGATVAPRRKLAAVGVFTLQQKNANPRYGLSSWEKGK